MKIRKRALPVGWYPEDSAQSTQEIDSFIRGFNPPLGPWIGGVAPHAGWAYSGKAAARAILTLSRSDPIDRVVILGGHLSGSHHPIFYSEEAWETPFGPLTIDTDLTSELFAGNTALRAPAQFADNTVEVQLPFVRYFFGDIPIIVGHSPASMEALQLTSRIQNLLHARKLRAVFLGSADLTHYGPNYGFSPKGSGSAAVEWVKKENDKALLDKAMAMDAEGIIRDSDTRRNTCSAGPIASVVAAARAVGVSKGTLLDYYTSHDVMPSSSFVGYAALVF